MGNPGFRAFRARPDGGGDADAFRAAVDRSCGIPRRRLIERFRNPALKHRTWQIAMDGSQKLPQRLLGTIRDRLSRGAPFDHLALGVAAWMRYVTGIDEKGKPIDVRDPLAGPLREYRRQVGADRAATGARADRRGAGLWLRPRVRPAVHRGRYKEARGPLLTGGFEVGCRGAATTERLHRATIGCPHPRVESSSTAYYCPCRTAECPQRLLTTVQHRGRTASRNGLRVRSH